MSGEIPQAASIAREAMKDLGLIEGMGKGYCAAGQSTRR